MPRKPRAATQAESASSPEDNGPAPGDARTAGATQQPSKPVSKKEAVERALDAGIKMPIEVADYVKRTFDIDITPAHVSTIKGGLNREKKDRKSKPGPKPRKEAPATPEKKQAQKATPQTGLTLEDLRSLAELAQRAGSVERLREFLDVLGSIR